MAIIGKRCAWHQMNFGFTIWKIGNVWADMLPDAEFLSSGM